MMPPFRAQSTRLYLREIEENDLASLRELLADPEQVRYIEFDATESSAKCLLDWGLQAARQQPRQSYCFAVLLRERNTFIGVVSLVTREPQSQAGDLGIVLNRCFHGKGFAVEAGQLLLSLAFEHLKLHRVCAGCHAENRACIRALERLGLRREAHLRQSHWQKGVWNDWLLYALLDHEWAARNANEGAF